ncbi:MAG TPA: NAD(P)-dependent oxidoreductase [Conexibacter sp.]|jgi:D-3-phosphoglycerate dehydrogenase|nr:NAD(P)-dependent oxidoreductase [Conexibacter sp.]
MSSARVVVVDPIVELPWSYEIERTALAEHGAELVVPDGPVAPDALLAGADVVIVSRRVTAEQVAALERCVGVVCYSVGVDGAAAAADAGIPIRSVPDYCSDEVADHALALLLAAERRLLPFAARGAAGDWDVRRLPELDAIRRQRGRTLGILGAGRIGRGVAQRARGFGYRTIAYDPFLVEQPPGLALVSFEQLLADSDALVLCAALTPGSGSVLDAAALARMRRGAILVNVARGGLIDERALAAALRDGRIGVAALDVRASEPPGLDDPLRELPNTILTQHLGSISRESSRDLHAKAAQAAVELLQAAGRVAG